MEYAVKQRNALNQLAPFFMTAEQHAASRFYRAVLVDWHITPGTLFTFNVYRFPQTPLQPTKHNENKLRTYKHFMKVV